MLITYHKYIEKPNDLKVINYLVLNNEIRDFLKERKCVQETYFFDSNNYYFFIYLDNGDRIDCALL